METIKQKYNRLRPSINDGDLVLFTGNAIVSKIIKNCDNQADWSHIEIVTRNKEDRLLVQGANMDGVHPEYMSLRLKYHTDFLIIRPTKNREEIDQALKTSFAKVDNGLSYDFSNGIRALINRKCAMHNIKFVLNYKYDNDNECICSTFAAPYAIRLNMVLPEFASIEFPFPQDFIRYIIKENVLFIK